MTSTLNKAGLNPDYTKRLKQSGKRLKLQTEPHDHVLWYSSDNGTLRPAHPSELHNHETCVTDLVEYLNHVAIAFSGHSQTKVAAVFGHFTNNGRNPPYFTIQDASVNQVPEILVQAGYDTNARYNNHGILDGAGADLDTTSSVFNHAEGNVFIALAKAHIPTQGLTAIVTGTGCSNCVALLGAAGFAEFIIPEASFHAFDSTKGKEEYLREVVSTYPIISAATGIKTYLLKENGQKVDFLKWILSQNPLPELKIIHETAVKIAESIQGDEPLRLEELVQPYWLNPVNPEQTFRKNTIDRNMLFMAKCAKTGEIPAFYSIHEPTNPKTLVTLMDMGVELEFIPKADISLLDMDILLEQQTMYHELLNKAARFQSPTTVVQTLEQQFDNSSDFVTCLCC